jgi:uncharacterized protein YraI
MTRQATWVGNKAIRVITMCVVLAALTAGIVAGSPISQVGAASFAVGDKVFVNTDYLNFREEPSLEAYRLHIFVQGDVMTVTGGPRVADGYTWYRVDAFVKGSMSGWVAGEYLALASQSGTGGFVVGETLVVDVARLNCRIGPGLDYAIDHVMNRGSLVKVLDGPVGADGYHWYKLEMGNGDIAWAIGEALAPAGAGPSPAFEKGQQVIVDTDFLNLRAGAGLTRSVVNVLSTDTALIVSNGPMAADGFNWYEVETRDGQLGWVAGEYLESAPGLGFAVGDAVRVSNGAQNLRKGAGLDAPVVRVMANGELLQVRGGPVEANGYTWYRIWNYGGEGWAAGEFLRLDPNGWPEEGGA